MGKTRKEIFGENLENIRKKKGVSRKQIAEMLEMDVNSYGAYERGEKNPPLKKLFKIADYLKVTVTELIGENSELADNKNFDYRLHRVMKLANLAGYSVEMLDNGIVEVEIPREPELNQKLDKKGSGAFIAWWSRVISIKNVEDFVKIFETAEEETIRKKITFNVAFKELIDTLNVEVLDGENFNGRC